MHGVNLAHIYTQLDLLYTFCQKEFIRNDLVSLTLFRGTHDAALLQFSRGWASARSSSN